MTPAPMAMVAERRWDSLDALRGTAAFLVLTFHCAQVFPGFAKAVSPLSLAAWSDPWTWLKFTPLRLLVSSGPSAVVLFFVLSGFVLSLPFLRLRKPSYGEFAIKRLCRIYPPFAAAVLLSAALYMLVRPEPVPDHGEWSVVVLWDQPLSLNYVLRNLMLSGLRQDMTLDLVMWSLVHELRISLVFPLLFVLTRRWPWRSMGMSLVVAAAASTVLAGKEATDFGTSLLDTARFLPMFVAGILIAGRVEPIRAGVARLPSVVAAGLWTAALALLMFPGPTMSNYYDFFWGAGAVVLLVMTIGSPRAGRLLSVSPLVWLGRVSYSLYLVHVPLLTATLYLTRGWLPVPLVLAFVIVLALACAELMFRLVEQPSIQLGRQLAALAQQGGQSPSALPASRSPR